MDDFAQIWFLMEEHVQTYLKFYALGIVVAVPFLYFTRKWTLPLILYAVEMCIYFSIMHVIIHAFVGITAWFRTNSSIRALRKDGMPIDAVYWTTPLVRFWDKTVYDPQWLLYVEYGFMVAIVFLVLKYRPMHTQKPKPRFGVDGKRKGDSEEAVAVAQKYGSRRYADDWAKESAKPPQSSRVPKQPGK
jgi:hypothetical protein